MFSFVALLTLGIAVFLYVRNRKRSSLPLPPGPKKLPILGNVLELPTSFEWETYAIWGKKYSAFGAYMLHLIRSSFIRL